MCVCVRVEDMGQSMVRMECVKVRCVRWDGGGGMHEDKMYEDWMCGVGCVRMGCVRMGCVGWDV